MPTLARTNELRMNQALACEISPCRPFLTSLFTRVRGIGILGSRGHAPSSLLNISGLMSGTKNVKITSIIDPRNGLYQDSDAKAPPSANTHTPKAVADT